MTSKPCAFWKLKNWTSVCIFNLQLNQTKLEKKNTCINDVMLYITNLLTILRSWIKLIASVLVIAHAGVGEGSHRHGDKSASFFAWVEWLVKVGSNVVLRCLTSHTREGGMGRMVVIVHWDGTWSEVLTVMTGLNCK